jgi:5-methylcytosine-specific restriction endonuclease McrA
MKRKIQKILENNSKEHSVISLNPNEVELHFHKESDTIDFLDSLSDLITQTKEALKKRHSKTAKNLQDWARKVKQNGMKCLVCGDTNDLQAHHIEPRSYASSLELSLENGAVLCGSHHREFHKIYGKDSVDRLNLLEWIDKMNDKKGEHWRPNKKKQYYVNYWEYHGDEETKKESLISSKCFN